MKELSKPVSSILTTIYRKSYETGQIPGDWKRANVAPIFKKGSKQDINNYRPILLTCISCKLLEHTIASSIMRHVHENNILYNLQHEFRDKRSCETDKFHAWRIPNRCSHNGLFQSNRQSQSSRPSFQVAQLCICGRTSQWIQRFLEGHTQSVVLDGEFSDSVNVLSGVSQGSVLGPVNDLPDSLSSNVRLFADETIVYLTIHSGRWQPSPSKGPRQASELGNALENEVQPGQMRSAESRAHANAL